jgi:rubrerythrin
MKELDKLVEEMRRFTDATNKHGSIDAAVVREWTQRIEAALKQSAEAVHKLVELPVPSKISEQTIGGYSLAYTADQLRTYGQACYETGKQSAAGERVDLEQFRPAVEALERAGRTSEVKDGVLHWTLNRKHYEAQELFALIDSQKSGEGDSTDYECPDCGKLNYKPLRCQNCGHDPQPTPDSAAHDGGCEIVGWVYEDQLPENYPYDAMFPFSKVDIVRMFPVYAPSSIADASKLGQGDVGARARELLAAEYERAGAVHTANDIRQDMLLHDWPQYALRAITAALSSRPSDDDLWDQTIRERDDAEDALGRMFQAVTGRPAEWSSAWHYNDAIEEVEEHTAALSSPRAHAETETAVDRLLLEALCHHPKYEHDTEDEKSACKWCAMILCIEKEKAAMRRSDVGGDMVLVRKEAIDWLNGESDFECPRDRYFRGEPPKYWWRSVFREKAGLATAPDEGGKDGEL